MGSNAFGHEVDQLDMLHGHISTHVATTRNRSACPMGPKDRTSPASNTRSLRLRELKIGSRGMRNPYEMANNE